ncbi:MAG: sensor histidine kinase [Thermoflexales bacterium]|nr:sensor histidine kinase [Thermoflexales bacterium]
MDYNGILAGLLLGWFSLALGFLLYRWVRDWWRAWRYGVPIDHSLLLVEYGRRMTSAPDRQALGQVLMFDVPRALQVEQAVLLVREGHELTPDGMSRLITTPFAMGQPIANAADSTSTLCLPLSHAAVRWVASAGEAQRADHGRLGELIRQGRDELSWTRVWVPLMRGTELRGLWLLGARRDERLYAPQDLRWLTALSREAAAVLETSLYAEQERQAASEMRALYHQLVAARELERGRLSRELHDGLLQDLCAVTRDLKAMEAQQESGQVLVADLAVRSGDSVQALRAICQDLRPPLLQHDLPSALKTLVQELDKRSPAPIHIEITVEALRLADDLALAIFRIAQEALNNAIRHADASEIALRLTQYPDRLRLSVSDDGRGIPGGVEAARFVAQGHFGLAGMRERAAMIGGSLDVQTAVDYGTVVILDLPLDMSMGQKAQR